MRDDLTDFWDRITIPLNYEWEENGADFVNPVLVADKFAEATGISTVLGQEVEHLTKKLVNAEYERKEVDRDIYKLRRRLLANHYERITKSASSEIQDAFLLKIATEENVDKELLELEARRDELTSLIDIYTPQIDLYKSRMRVLEKNMEWAKQWLDFEKLIERITHSGRKV